MSATARPTARRRRVLMLLLGPYERDARVEKQAATLVDAGHEVTVLAWNRYGTSLESEERDGTRIERVTVRGASGARLRNLTRIARVYAWFVRRGLALDWDVLVAHDLYTWLPGWVLKLLTRRRGIFDAHEPYAEQIVGMLPRLAPAQPLIRWCEGFLARRADALLTVTPRMVERCRSLRVKRVFYLPNVARVEPASAPPPGGHPDRLVIGRVGSITPGYSGVEEVLDVGRVLRGRGLPVRVVIGGPVLAGWEAEFRRIVAAASDYVEYLGVVPVGRVAGIVATFDVMLSLRDARAPKAYFGFSTKIFDAMAVGVPVVTTRVGEDPELVENAGCGEVVPAPVDVEAVADRVVAIWRDAALRKRMGEAGLRAVRERFRWATFEQGYLDLVNA